MATAMKRSIQEEQRDRRDRYICAALTGFLARSVGLPERSNAAEFAVIYADAAIAAADRVKP